MVLLSSGQNETCNNSKNLVVAGEKISSVMHLVTTFFTSLIKLCGLHCLCNILQHTCICNIYFQGRFLPRY